jgi:hypothetical protein
MSRYRQSGRKLLTAEIGVWFAKTGLKEQTMYVGRIANIEIAIRSIFDETLRHDSQGF